MSTKVTTSSWKKTLVIFVQFFVAS